MAMLAVSHGYLLTRMGRLDDALAAVRLGRSLVELVPMTDAWSSVGIAYIQLYRGNLDDSGRWCQLAHAAATARGEGNALLFAWDVLGHRRLREGAAAEACEFYAQLEATVHQMGIGEPCLPPWPRHAISAYLAAGRISDAERVLAWVDRSAQRLPCRYPRITVATGRAWLAELRGDRDSAHAYFGDAFALHEQVDLPVEQAETLLDFGSFLRRYGQPAQARRVLAQAIQVAEGVQAGWLAGLAHAELRVAGGRRRRPAASGAHRAGGPGGRAGRHRSQQSADRPPAIGVGQHRGDPPGADLRQARHRLPARADRDGGCPRRHSVRRRLRQHLFRRLPPARP